MTQKKFGKIGVLAGGPSSEREISLRSGRAVHKALVQEGCDANFFDITDNIYDIIKKHRIDVAFIALHGSFGEDGTVQGILKKAGIPYTGSDSDASALALDKVLSKQVFERCGIPVPPYLVIDKGFLNIEQARELTFPMVIKPHSEGSSIGLSIVKEESGYERSAEIAFRYGAKAIVEKYIDGRELTVGILDDKPLPVVEIITANRVYDYEAKYNDPATRYLVPAPIEEELAGKARTLGKLAHEALGCKSFSRVDMIVDRSGNIFVLEVNTIPGMTERSLLPKAAAVAGINFNKLCVKLIENAYETAKKV